MSAKNKGPDWNRIRAEYIKGGISQAKLAKKYGVSLGTLKRRVSKEKWSAYREESETKAIQKLSQKIAQKTADIQAETAAKLIEMQSRASLALYEKVLKNIENFPDGVGSRVVRETMDVRIVETEDGEEKKTPAALPVHQRP